MPAPSDETMNEKVRQGKMTKIVTPCRDLSVIPSWFAELQVPIRNTVHLMELKIPYLQGIRYKMKTDLFFGTLLAYIEVKCKLKNQNTKTQKKGGCETRKQNRLSEKHEQNN